MTFNMADFLRTETMPHIWCSGCGNGIVLRSFALALAKLGYSRDEVVVVSGVGCASRSAGYLDFDTLHTTHGRAIPFATGVKMSKPELKVFVLMGDGDATAIGGNHLIHACRRNIDLTAVIFNNNTYGMTGGQYSPLTALDYKATTAPYGLMEQAFDIGHLVQGAGASYFARATTYHQQLLTRLIGEGAEHCGFSVIEAITQCPTYYGRHNHLGNPSQMVDSFKQKGVQVEKLQGGAVELGEGQFPIGVIHKHNAPEFTALYQEVINRAQG